MNYLDIFETIWGQVKHIEYLYSQVWFYARESFHDGLQLATRCNWLMVYGRARVQGRASFLGRVKLLTRVRQEGKAKGLRLYFDNL